MAATPAATPITAPRSATPRPAATPAKPAASRLGAVKRGVIHEPYRYFLYGPEGVGKSSLAADAPDSIFIDTDRGSGRLDVVRYQFRDGSDGHIVLSLAEVYGAIDDLLANEHTYKTLVLDTADALEALLWKHVCEAAPANKQGIKPKSIEDFGYGKGYQVALDEWRSMLHRLDTLRLRRGMDIVLLGHSLVKTFKNPITEDYDRFRPKLDDRALGLLREWCDVIGFVSFEDFGGKITGLGERPRGWSSGRRVIHLSHHAAWDAKTRLPMPDEIDLQFERPWAPFAAAVAASRDLGPDDIRKLIDAELERLGAVFTKPDGGETNADAVRTAAGAATDTTTLTRYLNTLKQSQPKETQP